MAVCPKVVLRSCVINLLEFSLALHDFLVDVAQHNEISIFFFGFFQTCQPESRAGQCAQSRCGACACPLGT